jgi:hypothetical protein
LIHCVACISIAHEYKSIVYHSTSIHKQQRLLAPVQHSYLYFNSYFFLETKLNTLDSENVMYMYFLFFSVMIAMLDVSFFGG